MEDEKEQIPQQWLLLLLLLLLLLVSFKTVTPFFLFLDFRSLINQDVSSQKTNF